MYFKVRMTKDNIEVVGKSKRIGKDKDEFLYLTKEEMDLLNPKILIGYDVEDNANKLA